MTEFTLIGLTCIIVFGVGAQWLAWRTRLPAILLLLLAGIMAGPVLGWIDPDAMMGDLLAPFISVSVAIILFEGGLSLRISELKEVGGTVGNLVSIGVLVSWTLTGLAAHYFFGFGWDISILLGAILVVTGPTVILPLLRQVRPSGQVGSILKWEGIIIDPIGAMLAVLVFEVILAGSFTVATNLAIMSIIKTIFFGSLVGVIGAAFIYYLLKQHMLPDFLQNPVSLMIVVSVFTISNLLQHESGLWATTLMGIILANQTSAQIYHITKFKEDLRVLLLSALFILLAARIELESLINNLNWQMGAFLLVLIFVIRPLTVYLSTLFADINWREKLFLSWMAPRGVVAASIASIFAIRLTQNGFEQADQLVPIVFTVIISTVTIYGLPASWIARKLKVAKPVPNGVLIVGAQEWSIKIAKVIQDEGFKVLVADSNRRNISKAKREGLKTYHGNILSEYALEEVDLDGIGRMLSLTSNDEVNSLAALRFGEIFGRSNVYQLSNSSGLTDEKAETNVLMGRILFNKDMNFKRFENFKKGSAELKVEEIEDRESFQSKLQEKEKQFIPLFLISANHQIQPFTVENKPSPTAGEKVIFLSVNDKALVEKETA